MLIYTANITSFCIHGEMSQYYVFPFKNHIDSLFIWKEAIYDVVSVALSDFNSVSFYC